MHSEQMADRRTRRRDQGDQDFVTCVEKEKTEYRREKPEGCADCRTTRPL
jgi:hypothetical protein